MSYAYRACSRLTAGPTRCVTSRLSTFTHPTTFCSATRTFSHNVRSNGQVAPTVRTAAWPPPAAGLTSSIPRRSVSRATARAKARDSEGDETARETNQRDLDEHEQDVRQAIAETTKQQIRRPWQREGADEPPVSEHRTEMNKKMVTGMVCSPRRSRMCGLG